MYLSVDKWQQGQPKAPFFPLPVFLLSTLSAGDFSFDVFEFISKSADFAYEAYQKHKAEKNGDNH